MLRKISQQLNLPIRRKKITTEDRLEFYDYFRTILANITETLTDIIYALNASPAKAEYYRSTTLDTSVNGGAGTWIDVPFDTEGIESANVEKLSSNYEIRLKAGGWYWVVYGLYGQNNAGVSVDAPIYGRVVKNGTEVAQSIISRNVTKDDGENFPLGPVPFLLRVSEDDIIKVQWRSAHVDIDLQCDTTFDNINTAYIALSQIESK